MKKKNLVLLSSAAMLSLALAGSIGTAVVASAATEVTNGNGGNSTTVTYTVADSWKITVPESITVGGDGGTIKAEDVKIKPGDELNVTVSSTNEWKVQKDAEHQIEYELKTGKNSGSALGNGDKVLTVEAGSDGDQDTLTATVKSGSENYSTGGEAYTDMLTFTVTSETKAG